MHSASGSMITKENGNFITNSFGVRRKLTHLDDCFLRVDIMQRNWYGYYFR